jgi:hypothetical protein
LVVVSCLIAVLGLFYVFIKCNLISVFCAVFQGFGDITVTSES